MTGGHAEPIEEDGEPSLVRPYAMVRGRTRASGTDPLPVEAIAVTIDQSGRSLPVEQGAIARLCDSAHSVAEISAILRIPVGVVRVLVADLVEADVLLVNMPGGRNEDGTTDLALLERMLAGLEAL